MRIKLHRAARKIMEKKIWRDSQIKAIEADLDNLEEIIQDNWDTIGYIDRSILYLAHDFINEHLYNRDKRVIELIDWIQKLDILADERASFSSCLR